MTAQELYARVERVMEQLRPIADSSAWQMRARRVIREALADAAMAGALEEHLESERRREGA